MPLKLLLLINLSLYFRKRIQRLNYDLTLDPCLTFDLELGL
jgi:hypothetical protein